jgi:hypothetical protein
MSDKRQNNQLRLAFGEEGRSEAPMAPGEGSETLTAKRMNESPANNSEQLMEEVCIFQVNEDCSVIREENFAVIGSGCDVANAMLCYRQQHEELSIEETAYNLFEATKFARKAKVPGVGKLHAFSVLYPHRRQRRLRERGLRQLKKYFKRYGPQRVKKLGLPKGSWQPYE